jgi:long-chain fatty acid transport protein
MHHHSRKLLALALAALAPSAWASGFALQNQTGSGNGTAFAGAAAAAEDAGTVYFNPAGMTLLGEGDNVALAGTLINRSIKFTNNGSTANTTALGQIAPLPSTNNGGDAGGLSLVPAGYWTHALTNQMWFGLGISPTFGNTTEYDFDFVGRNAGYYAKMEQININPSLAFKINEQISLGFGIDIAHNMTHFKQGYPITAAPNVNACAPLPTCAALNSANNYADIEGDAWGYGYNFGVMYSVTPMTRLALTYRSQIKFDLEGKFDANAPVAGGAVFGDHDIKATLKTPDNASLALSQKLSDQLELLADVTWTGWSIVDTIKVTDKNTGATVTSLSYNFKDTWRYGIGANYQYNDQWKLRAGLAYDQAPVKSDADRTMTLPDSDRTWLSFGARYSLSKASSIDMGYTHLFFKNASTARAVTTSLGTVETIRGNIKTSADLFSLQYNQKF